jgi:hypothetical protein
VKRCGSFAFPRHSTNRAPRIRLHRMP